MSQSGPGWAAGSWAAPGPRGRGGQGEPGCPTRWEGHVASWAPRPHCPCSVSPVHLSIWAQSSPARPDPVPRPPTLPLLPMQPQGRGHLPPGCRRIAAEQIPAKLGGLNRSKAGGQGELSFPFWWVLVGTAQTQAGMGEWGPAKTVGLALGLWGEGGRSRGPGQELGGGRGGVGAASWPWPGGEGGPVLRGWADSEHTLI